MLVHVKFSSSQRQVAYLELAVSFLQTVASSYCFPVHIISDPKQHAFQSVPEDYQGRMCRPVASSYSSRRRHSRDCKIRYEQYRRDWCYLQIVWVAWILTRLPLVRDDNGPCVYACSTRGNQQTY